MALVNQAKREINAKIVYFGPGLSGKATNLKHVHSKLKPDFRGAMKAMSVQDARMLFFDFTPPGEGNVQGYRVRFHVYTVSGNVVEPAAWKMVLKGVDGVVFVADATPERAAANQESLAQLTGFLKGYSQSLSSVPMVLQYNKCDLPGALSPDELDLVLNPARVPSFKASSQAGEGVLQTLLSLVKSVLHELRSKGVEGVAESLQGMVEGPAAVGGAPAPAVPAAPKAKVPAPEVASPQAPPASQAPQAQQAQQAQQASGTPQASSEPLQAAPPAPAAVEPVPAAAEAPLSLELSGAPQCTGPGLFRLPLTIRSGERTKSVLLNIALSLEG